MKNTNNKNGKGWQFLNIGIAAPQPMMDTVQRVFKSVFENEINNADGIFSSKVNIPMEDESLDELLEVEVYGLHGSFATFLSELQQYKVDSVTFGGDITKGILRMLHHISTYIKNNTDKPQAIKNKIISVLKLTGKAPVLGKMCQIATLIGLYRMLECCEMSETDARFHDFINLHDWILIKAGEKVMEFSIMPMNWIMSEEDMERIQPFCDYLYYGTDVGKVANEMALNCLNEDNDDADNSVEDEVEDSECQTTSKEDAVKGDVGKVGRHKSIKTPFWNLLNGDEAERDSTLKTLHDLIDGKKGKYVAKVIYACVMAKKMSKPTHEQMKLEFGEIGNKQGFSEHYAKKSFKGDELAKMIELFQ